MSSKENINETDVHNEKHESVSNEQAPEASAPLGVFHPLDREPTLREYMQFAANTRSKEDADPSAPRRAPGFFEKSGVDQQELDMAHRALRSASWIAIFFLITTDILGPFNAPYAISQVGYVPGTILYIVMGGAACYTGLLLSRLFCRLDSYEYPVRTYADLGGRVFGNWFKHMCTALQSLQLIVNVGTICLANGQSVEQIAGNHQFCFSGAILIWTAAGMIIGQIRTLKAYGWLANSAVWLNLLVIFTSMGFVSHSPPNFESAKAAFNVDPGPIMKENFVSNELFAKVNGIMNMVFAYGGAMIFPEFMAEMRRPMDFWKGMVCAQLLISTVYLLYGLFVYSFQGQFTLPLAFQGVSKKSWQDLGNIIGLITGLIAAGLYGNIGIKVAYYQIVEGWFRGPSLLTRRGKLLWPFVVILYWALAFIIASAIPQVQTISGLIAAICIMQFTYTFPPLIWLGYQVRIHAEGLKENGGEVGAGSSPGDTYNDSYLNWSKWKRGFFGGKWYWNLFNLIFFLGGSAMACLGMFGSGTAIRETFKNSAATSFGCKSPV